MSTYPLNNSLRQAYKKCPRIAVWQAVAGLEPRVKGKALCMGSAFHKGLEHWRHHKGEQPNLAIDEAATLLTAELEAGGMDRLAIDFELSKLSAYLQGYFMVYASDMIVPWHTEVKIELDGEYGTIDALYEDADGVWVVDDKTRSELSPDQPSALGMEEQLLNYALLVKARGWDLAGVVWRETLKTACRPRAKETPLMFHARLFDEYCTPTAHRFYRETKVRFTEKQLHYYAIDRDNTNGWLRSLLTVASEPGYDHDLTPFNSANCIGPYGACEFLKLCSKDPNAAKHYKPNDRKPLDHGAYQKTISSELTERTPEPRLPSGGGAPTDRRGLPQSPGGQQAPG